METIMVEPLLEILEIEAEEDIDNSKKKRKPSTPGPVSLEELIKPKPEIEVKKAPVIKTK
jgi:hypothetical protein